MRLHQPLRNHVLQILRAIGLGVVLSAFGLAQAATIPLVQDGHYFQGWDLSYIQPSPNVPGGYNCFSGPPDLPPDEVIHGTLGPLNYQVTALTPATPPANNQWQICNWYWGAYIPSGNDTVGTPGSVNYNKGNYDIVADRPFVSGTLMAFQDMDALESALLTFKDCQGNPVDPAGFDTLVPSSDYTSTTTPIATSQYVGGSPPAWKFTSQGGNVPNVTIGLLLKAPNICSIHIVGPTAGGSGGVAFYFAAPKLQAATLTVSTPLSGGPDGYSANIPINATCTLNGADVTNYLQPAPPQNSTTSSGTPGTVTFSGIPVGAQCSVSLGSYPAAPSGYSWGPAPAPVSVTIAGGTTGNTASLPSSLASSTPTPIPTPTPAPVPTLGGWMLLALMAAVGWLGTLRLRQRRV